MEGYSSKQKHLSTGRKIGYGLGDFGANFCWTFVASFIMIYCSNTLGVSTAIVGTILMISKILDGFSDVVMGRIIDKTNHRMGKARFWYFVSCFPVALLTFFIFNVPAGFSDKYTYAYIFIIYTLLGAVAYTMNNIAYSALVSLVTNDSKDRVQMGTYRFIFAIIAVLLISTFTTTLTEVFGGGQRGWTITALIYAGICLVFLLIPVFSVKELPQEELLNTINTNDGENSDVSFFQGVILLLKNKYFLIILGVYFFTYFFSGVTSGLGIYFATYKLNNASLLGVITMAGSLPAVIGLPFAPFLAGKFGLRNSSLGGMILGLGFGVVILLGGFLDSFPIMLAGLMGKALGGSITVGCLTALVAEVSDYSYLKTGKQLTGMVFSCSSVGLKIGTGLGTAVCGLLLEISGFDGKAIIQSEQTINAVNWSYLAANVVPILIVVILLYFFRVEKDNKKRVNHFFRGIATT